MKIYSTILKLIAALFILGGVIRLMAGESAFGLFGMTNLWSDHFYFVYIYRVLGAFVILTGLLLFVIATNLEKYRPVLMVMKWGFLLIGMTMLLAGYFTGLPVLFYAPDFVFCFALSLYLQFN
ncbi:MAG: hypothetical protein KQI35_06080 [Bacteroidetes bacterium]|nr:hypothetical protein [Bacteroidota bacterium]